MEILLLILGLVLFVTLVVVHEWGHFIVARRNGVDVEEFGIGFPPKMFTFYKDKKGTEYTWNWLPLGGFVRLKGEHDADTEKGTFGAVSFGAKTRIILAGVAMNLVTAWVMFSLLAAVGIPKLPLPGGVEQFSVRSDTTIVSNKVFVGYVEPDGPADRAGLESGDQITSISTSQDSLAVTQASDLRVMTEQLLASDDKIINIGLIRGGQAIVVESEPRSLEAVAASEQTEDRKGYLGVVPYDYTIQRSTWSSPIVGAGLVGQFAKLTYEALGKTVASLFQGKGQEASQNVAGPVGIFVVLRDGASLGVTYILLIIALLSLTLAIMNTLPIPALDGGKLAVMALFRAIKKPLTPQIEERIHGSGFLLLMALFVLITVVDVRRFL